MASTLTNTYNAAGLAEDFENIIYDISPTETPLLSMCKRKKATATYHQWQTDALTAAGANRQIEGLDSTFATLSPTTVLGNYCQISSKTVNISRTQDTVRKYGRKSETARYLMRAGLELKRDMEYAIVRNQASSAGGQATARSTASIESWIGSESGNMSKANADATTIGFAAGVVAAPTDGTAVTFIEGDFTTALGLAWTDGGNPSQVLMSSTNKARFSAFAGIATKYNEVKGKNEAIIVGAADMYVSSFGNHAVKLDRFMRNEAILMLDPDYVSIAILDPMRKEELAKTGDSTKWLVVTEYCLVVDNPDAHAKLASVGA